MSMIDYGGNTRRWRYGEVRINNAAGVTLDTDVTQTNNNSVRDDIRVQSGTFNTGGFSILLPDAKEFEVADGATYSTTSTDASGGIPTFNGAGGIYNYADNSTVIFAAVGDQAVPGITTADSDDYGNVTISGSGTKTLGQPLNDAYDGGSGNIDLAGDLTISAGTFDVSTSNYSIELAGNWSNTTTFDERSGTVTFDGGSPQSISNASGETFYNLIADNSSTGVTLSTGNAIASNALTMIQGNIDSGTDKLVLGTSTANVGTLNYTVGNVIGQFERWINSTGTPINFPVGTAANNNLFTIDYTDLTSGSLVTEFVASDPGATGLPLFESGDQIDKQFTEGYWSVTAVNSLASTDYDIELTGNGFTSYIMNADTRIIKRLNGGSPWTFDGSHAAGVAPVAYRDGLSGISTAHFGLGVLCPVPTSTITGDNSVCVSATGIGYSVVNNTGYTYAWTISGGTSDPEPSSGQGTSSIIVDWGVAGAGDVSVTANFAACGSAAPVNLPVIIGSGIISSTVSNSNTSIIVVGTPDAELLQIQLVVGPSCGAITDFNLNTTGTPGSSDPANDLLDATIYYTGTSSTFATTTPFGTLGISPSGAFTISGSQVLPVSSTVYFWLAYDTDGGATESNIVDAQLESIDIAGINYTGMTISDPAGSRVLHVPVTRYSVANGSWNTTASWSAVSGGAPGASVPIIGDIVYIEESFDITITGTQTCDTIIILGNDGANRTELIVDGGTLNVGGGMFISGEGGATTYNRDGRFTVENSGSATVNGNVSLLADERDGDINVDTDGVLTINGDVSLTSTNSGSRSELEVDDATLNINGDINFLGALGDDDLRLRLRGTAIFNFTGNFDRTAAGNYGELNCDAGSVFNFNGTSAQTMSMIDYGGNTRRWRYGEVRINNAAGVTLDTDVTQTNNNSVRDDIRVQSGTFNTGGFSILLPDAKEFEVADGATYSTTSTDASGGIPTFDGLAGIYNYADNSTVIFAAAGDQTIPGMTAVDEDDYGNVTISGSGTKTLAQPLNDAYDGGSGNIDIAGDLTISAGTFDVSASSYAIELAGNWSNTATYNARSGTVTLNGASGQTLTLGASDLFYDVVVNNTSTGLVSNGDFKVSNSLSMTQGNID